MPPKSKEVTSQATPLAKDILSILQGQLKEGSFGVGVGPLQQQAGTAAQQFVSSGTAGRGGTEGFDLSPLLAQLEEIQNRRVGEAAGDLREGFGIAGSRFGTPLAVGEAKLRTDLESEFGANIGELLRQSFESQQQRQLFAQGQQLQGINQLQTIGQGNIAPFLGLSALGISPDAFTENPFLSILKGIGSFAGSPGAAPPV